jgi:hypothetical protein
MRMCAIALACALGGCSFFMTPVPKTWREQEAPRCTSGRDSPVLDTVMAVAVGALTARLIYDYARCDGEFCGFYPVVWVPGVIITAIYGAGASTGYSRARKCREAKRRYASMSSSERRRAQNEVAPAEIARATGMDATVAKHTLRLGSASSSSACMEMKWTGRVSTRRRRLRALGVRRVTCRAGSRVIWSGALNTLPTTVDQTPCKDVLAAFVMERSPMRRRQLRAGIPSYCRGAIHVHEWHGAAVSAAARGDCRGAVAMVRRIRWASGHYYTERILPDARLQPCLRPGR